MTYDPNNIFARILRGDIPCKKVFENDHVLAFHDINPQAPVHVLVIPKGAYESVLDFSAHAPVAELAGFWQAVPVIAAQLGIDQTGFRTIANTGVNGGQEVPHFHIHLLGGHVIGPMVAE